MFDIITINEDILKMYPNALNISVTGSVIEEMIGISIIPHDVDITVVLPNEACIDNDKVSFKNGNIDVDMELLHEDQFIELLNKVEAKFLLASFSNTKYIQILQNATKQAVRHSVSNISSKAYAKGIKKLTVPESFDAELGLKNVWHSIKFPYYAKWFYRQGSDMNLMIEDSLKDVLHLNEIRANIFKIYQNSEEPVKEVQKYAKPILNATLTEFRKLFPK